MMSFELVLICQLSEGMGASSPIDRCALIKYRCLLWSEDPEDKQVVTVVYCAIV